MLILLFYFLGISLWLNLFPPCLKDLWWYGGRWKQNSLLVSRQKRVLTALTAWKWESGRPQPVPNCYPEFLFIPCYSRTHFWITYLKFTQQNTREKKSVKSLVAMWITKKKAQKNKFFSLGKRVKDFFFFFNLCKQSKIFWLKFYGVKRLLHIFNLQLQTWQSGKDIITDYLVIV